MYVIVSYAMHQQEANVILKSCHVADACVLVSAGVMLRCVHVAFSVDGI